MRDVRGMVLAASLTVVLATAGCVPGPSPTPDDATPTAPTAGACTDEDVAVGADGEAVRDIVQSAGDADGLTSVLYRVTRDGELIAAGAVGDSVTGIPVTQDMHFRNGNVAFAYMGTLLLLMAQEGVVSLDDTVATWLPDLEVPNADTVTLKMLAASTSGYPDYVPDDAFADAFLADPFRGFTPQQLIDHAFTTAPWYEPGTAWNYAHTNYVILGEALAAAGGEPLGDLLTERVLEPMGLQSTVPVLTPLVPAPVLHTFSTERGMFEETTFWNPSWQTAPGAVIATDICDMVASAEAIGTGALLDPASFDLMIAPETAALAPPPATCTVCRQFNDDQYYGLGVIVRAGWIHQTPLFGGAGDVHAYLPSEGLAVALVAVAGADSTPNTNYAVNIWTSIARELTPENVPPS
jgi:CubicO group peptidase (beta-lactamase class C family)